jgi:mycothiol S-conjugate amidase
MLVPDEKVTTWVDISGDPLEAKWQAMHEHRTQLNDEFPFLAVGLEGWQNGWAKEAFILRESKVETARPESDLFAGIV